MGRAVSLHTHLVVRDDALALYGFATEEERDLFLALIGVQSVGPKVALAVLSGGTPRELVAALVAGDVARLQAVPGIGKRTAERIVVELREKVGVPNDLDDADHRHPRRRPAPRRPRRPARARLPARRGAGAARGRRGRDGRGAAGQRAARRHADEPRAHPHPRRAGRTRTSSTARCARARLEEFVGQDGLREQLQVSIEAAAARGEALDHVLLAGPPGLGKTSLAQIIASELEVPFVQTAGPALERKGDIAALLSALEPRAVFFVDEVHRLNRALEETFYPAMEDRPAADHHRPGRGGQGRHPRPAALHAHRRHHPRRAC